MRSLCSKSCEDCPSLSELKSEPLGFQAALICPDLPVASEPPLTSSSWSLLPPRLPLFILSTLSLRGVCTPDLSVRKLCVQASAWPALYLLSGLCSDTISHWNLPWPSFFSLKGSVTFRLWFQVLESDCLDWGLVLSLKLLCLSLLLLL